MTVVTHTPNALTKVTTMLNLLGFPIFDQFYSAKEYFWNVPIMLKI